MKPSCNEVRTNATAQLFRAVALALLVVSLISLVCPISLAWQGAKTKHEVTGRWQGKFPLEEGSRVLDADNPVAVEVIIKDEGGKLSGTATYYVIRNQDGKPKVMGNAESALIDPQFDGATLKFSVKAKGPQADKEARVEMQMKLTSATEAELENLDDSSAPLFKMKKVQ